MSLFTLTRENDEKDIILISKALGSETRFQILKILKENNTSYSITELAQKLKQTEANISSQVKKLEKVGLVQASYKPGNHGVIKLISLNFEKITILF